MNGKIKKLKDLEFVSTNISVSSLIPFSNFENGLRKETEILVETNFRLSFFFFFFVNFTIQKCCFWLFSFPMFGCVLFFIIHQLFLAIQLQMQLNHQRKLQHWVSMLSTALGFTKSKTVTDNYSILAQEAVDFTKVAVLTVLNKWQN